MVSTASRMVRAISLGVFWRLAPSTSAIIRSRKVWPALGGDPHDDPVGEHLGPAGDRRAVAAGLADDRGRLAGDGRLVDRGDALDDLAVGGDEVAGLAHHEVALGQRGGGHQLLGAVGQQAPGLGLRAHLAQGVSACALPRPSAMASAKLAKSTVRNSQMVMDQLKMPRMGDGLDEGDDRADQHHEHDRVLDLHPGVELVERVDEGLAAGSRGRRGCGTPATPCGAGRRAGGWGVGWR